MSLKNKELIEKNQYELTFEVERSVFDAAVEKVYRRQAKNITIPGFRRGKAPRSIIEKMYGKGVFYEDAVNEVLPEAYEAAAKESGLDIVGRPEFDMEPIEDGNITLKAKVYIKPEVKIEGYKGIAAERTVEPVTDEEVNAEIDRIRASTTVPHRTATPQTLILTVMSTASSSTAARAPDTTLCSAPVHSSPDLRSRSSVTRSATSST